MDEGRIIPEHMDDFDEAMGVVLQSIVFLSETTNLQIDNRESHDSTLKETFDPSAFHLYLNELDNLLSKNNFVAISKLKKIQECLNELKFREARIILNKLLLETQERTQ